MNSCTQEISLAGSDDVASFDEASSCEMIEDMFEGCGYTSKELDDTMKAERDVLGTNYCDFPQQQQQSTIVMERAHAGLLEAVADLPNERRAAYDEAMRRSPAIVELESPPGRFLQICEFNLWTAAERLCDYWNERRSIFSEERYHLPLKLTPGGALSEEAMDLIKRGVATILPTDEFSRMIFFVDREYATDDWHGKTRLQVFFYMLNIISESDAGLKNGWVGVLASPTETKSSAKTNPDGSPLKLVQSEAVPAKIKALHLLALKKSSFPQVCLNLWLSFARSWNFLNFRIRVHQSGCKDQLVKNINDFGLSKAHLPQRFGGSSESSHASWYEQRLLLEKERYSFLKTAAPCSKEDARVTVTSHSARDQQQKEQTLKRRVDALKEMSEEYAIERELSRLLSEVSALATENSKLKNDHGYLEVLCRLGSHVVVEFAEERQRIRNRLCNAFSVIIEQTTDVLPLYRNDHTLPGVLADWLLTHLIVFMGRDQSTQERLFSRRDGKSAPGEIVRIKDDEDIPGMAEFLQRLQLALQGKVALEDSLIEMSHAPKKPPKSAISEGTAVAAASSSGRTSRGQNRAKRIKLLKRL